MILYVGRPTDLNKGIEVFFQAIKRLYRINTSFITWIIGGNEKETLLLKSWIKKDNVLNEIHLSGKLVLWGRIVNDALAEFYSRASVCVMPSFNETFGMVAVESMLCGCPVIASNTGGLKNVIKNGHSGFLVESGNDIVISIYLLLILNNRDLSDWLSENSINWAKMNFSREATFSIYPLIYANCQVPNSSSKLTLNEDFNRIKLIIKEKLDGYNNFENISTSQHLVCANTHFIIKEFKEKMCSQSYLIPKISANKIIHIADELFNRCVFFAEFNNAPRILHKCTKQNILIYEKLIAVNIDIGIKEISTLISAIKEFGHKYKITHLSSIKNKIKELYKSDELNTYNNYLKVGNKLNKSLTDGIESNHRIHPQLDIKFMFELYIKPKNLFPDNYRIELVKICKELMSIEFLMDEIWLAHGEINNDHLFMKDSNLCLIDYETARYAFGELDNATWILNTHVWIDNDFDIDEIIDISNSLVKSNASFQLLLLWEVSEIIYRIIRIHAYEHLHFNRIPKYLNFIKKISLLITNDLNFIK